MNDSQQLLALAASRLHVYVDFSNFYVSLISMCRPDAFAKFGPSFWRTLFPTLMRIITNGRLADSRVFVGSIPPAHEEIWNWARDAGFQVCLFPRAHVPSPDGEVAKPWKKHGDDGADHKPWKAKYAQHGAPSLNAAAPSFAPGSAAPASASASASAPPFYADAPKPKPGLKLKEVGVDNTLHAQILLQLCDRVSNPDSAERTISLVTGDGNENKGAIKDYFMRPTTFPVCVQLALQNGWNVRVYAWRSSCSGFYRDLAEHRTPRFTLVYLDEFAAALGVVPFLAATPAPASGADAK